MLLIHDDEAQVLQRSEHRAARAEDHWVVAIVDLPPLVEALALAKAGMLKGYLAGEARCEPPECLRGERDLGDEDDGAPPGVKARLDRAQIHLGLACAGDAEEQEFSRGLAGLRLLDGLRHCRDGGSLLGRRVGRERLLDDVVAERVSPDPDALEPGLSRREQGLDRGLTEPAGHPGFRPGSVARGEPVEERAPAYGPGPSKALCLQLGCLGRDCQRKVVLEPWAGGPLGL